MTTRSVFAGAFMIWVAPAQAGGVCDLPTNSELSQCMSNEVAKAELDLSYTYRQVMDSLYVDKDPTTTAKSQGSLKSVRARVDRLQRKLLRRVHRRILGRWIGTERGNFRLFASTNPRTDHDA